MILFNAIRDNYRGYWEIDALDSPEGAPRCLTDPILQNCIEPRPAPGGETVAFVSSFRSMGARSSIYIINMESGEPVRLTGTDSDRHIIGWTPDGKILFLSDVERDYHLYLIDSLGKEARRIPHLAAVDDAAISPVSGEIALTFRRADGQIYLAKPDGKDLRHFTGSPPAKGRPGWSPDGSQLAFIMTQSIETLLMVVEADGSLEHPVAKIDPQGCYAWSPDGRQIALVGEKGLWHTLNLVRADGTGLCEITQLNSGDRDHQIPACTPAWSPDGRQVLYSTRREVGFSLESYDVVSGETRVLAGEDAGFAMIYDLWWID